MLENRNFFLCFTATFVCTGRLNMPCNLQTQWGEITDERWHFRFKWNLKHHISLQPTRLAALATASISLLMLEGECISRTGDKLSAWYRYNDLLNSYSAPLHSYKTLILMYKTGEVKWGTYSSSKHQVHILQRKTS